MIDFQGLLASVKPSGEANQYCVSVDDTWLQGRTAFGGLSAALICQAMQQQVDGDRRLRALSVVFVGPVPAGEHRIVIRELRAGGSVSHLQGELVCDGEVAVTVSASYGKNRLSAIKIEAPSMPHVTPPESLTPLPYIKGITPQFTQHFDMRIAFGELPFRGAASADFGIWLRFPNPRAIDVAALVALADAPPMPGLNMIKPPGAGSSLSWYLEFPADLPSADASQWWYCDYRCQAAGDGYFHNNATIWGPEGKAVMFSRQIATVFEK